MLRDTLRGDANAGTNAPDLTLSDREMDVLARLESQTDREIARALKLSHAGVRYRVRSIFAKLGVRGRLDAVRLRPGTGHPGCGRGAGDRFVARGNLRRQGGAPARRPPSELGLRPIGTARSARRFDAGRRVIRWVSCHLKRSTRPRAAPHSEPESPRPGTAREAAGGTAQ